MPGSSKTPAVAGVPAYVTRCPLKNAPMDARMTSQPRSSKNVRGLLPFGGHPLLEAQEIIVHSLGEEDPSALDVGGASGVGPEDASASLFGPASVS
jgi:hypothetical protein